MKKWRVKQLRCNFSAFNGYRYCRSDYSLIECFECGAHWRTKAAYVDRLDFHPQRISLL